MIPVLACIFLLSMYQFCSKKDTTLIKIFFVNYVQIVFGHKIFIIMQTTKLSLLRELRTQEKALKARIDQIMPAAADEAVAILASQGLDRGEFTIPGVGTFQLQRTDVIDMTNYNRYKGEDAIRWRQKNEQKEQSRKYQAALTREMKGITDAFVATHPDWSPDEIKLTVKVID